MTKNMVLISGVVVIVYLQACLGMTIREEMMLSDDELQAFNGFKAEALLLITTEYMKKDLVLMKYFKYAGKNEKKAMELLIDNLKFRVGWGFEKLTEKEVNHYLRDVSLSKFPDKFGRQVVFTAGKTWDIASASSTPEGRKKFANVAYHIFEEAYRKGVTTPNQTSAGMIGLLDLKDTDLVQHFCVTCIDLLQQIALEADVRWPGGVQVGISVNAHPLIAPTINFMVKALPENIRKSGAAYDEDDTIWMPELMKFIPPGKIPHDLYIESRDPTVSSPIFGDEKRKRTTKIPKNKSKMMDNESFLSNP